MEHAEALSPTSELAFAPFSMSLRPGIGWVARITYSRCGRIKIVYEGQKTGGMGRGGSSQVRQHPVGFIGSADVVIFSTVPGV